MQLPQTLASARSRAQHLQQELREANAAYFNGQTPLFSEDIRDQLKQELLALEAAYPELITPESPTQQVGSPVESSGPLEKYAHKTRRYSLSDCFTLEQVQEFDARVRRYLGLGEEAPLPYSTEWKIDGINVTLWYEQGQLTRALTRGDGQTGEDITHAISTILSLPHQLSDPVDMEVTGEVFITREDFAALHAEGYANARNLTAGTVRQLDPTVAAQRQLQMRCYALGAHTLPTPPTTQQELFALFTRYGLPVAEGFSLHEGIAAVVQFLSTAEQGRHRYAYDTDGVVVKLHDFALRERLGYTAKTARYAVAFKFPPEQQYSRLESVTWQVGRTGVLTPVAELSPVLIDGSTVSRATLHNPDEIARKGVLLGDSVVVQKAGDIIPEIVEPLLGLRDGTQTPIPLPSECPSCGQPLQMTGPQWRCENDDCPAQLLEKVVYLAGVLDIRGLGRQTVTQLLTGGHLHTVADLWRLDETVLSTLEGYKEKKIQNLINSLQQRKHLQLDTLLSALSIPLIGTETARSLTHLLQTHGLHAGPGLLQQLSRLCQTLTKEALTEHDGIGQAVAEEFLHWVRAHTTLLEDLTRVGLTITLPEETARGTHPRISGRSFVITGTLHHYSRAELKTLLVRYGGRLSSSVSGQTDVLIVGEKPGSKLTKAQELGTEVWDEATTVQMLGS
ncbi:NAD-dependent DNA ligase LigA [Candidatus Peribacteria bacterium]|nr:NAD-dependent DNA ligase LigA [Candidatus Peribacteria bacterium]